MGLKSPKKKEILALIFFLVYLPFSMLTEIDYIDKNSNTNQFYEKRNPEPNDNKLKTQGSVIDYYQKQWIENPTFTYPIDPWFSTLSGDNSDVRTSSDSGQANFEILGETGSFSLIADPPSASNWTETINPDFPEKPDDCDITSEGCRVSHEFNDQTAVQNPSVHWDQNISLPINMSDFIITSTSIKTIVKATVDENLDRYGDLNTNRARADDSRLVDTYGFGDFVRFYVLISDLTKDKVYEIAHYQTEQLGTGNPPGKDYLADTDMINIPEEDLIYYLSSVLSNDYCNFTVTLGIKLFIEDNLIPYYDIDTFDELIIKYLNLTFTYEKKIDQSTSISWVQVGDKIIGDDIDIIDARLNFKYRIDQEWTLLSPNSEIRILINNMLFTETIKLSTANISFQDAKSGGFDVSSLILDNVNITISLQVFLADQFQLDRYITISIDDVFLNISYTLTTPEDITSYTLFLNGENKTLGKFVEVILGRPLNIMFKYKNSTSHFISNATVVLNGMGSPKALTENNETEEYSIEIDTDLFEIGDNFLTLSASKKYYETQVLTITVNIIKKYTDLQLFLNSINKTIDKSVELKYGTNLNITVKYLNKEVFPNSHISRAHVELTGLDYPKFLTEDLAFYQYTTIINTTHLGLGINYLTINAQKQNYSSLYIQFQINVDRIDIEVNPIDFESPNSKKVFSGRNVKIRLSLKDSTNNNTISNAKIHYKWDYGSGNLTEISEGIYECEIDIPNNIKGNYEVILNISKEDSVYQSRDFSFLLIISKKKEVDPLQWIIPLTSFIVTAILSTISLRTYVIIPRKRKRELDLLLRTQRFKDVKNIQAIVIATKKSGLTLFIKTYSILKQENEALFPGFIQAIMIMGEKITEESRNSAEIADTSLLDGDKSIIELDFRYFHSLISDKKDIRVVLILNEKPSERLKAQVGLLSSKLDDTFYDKIQKWDGDLKFFKKSIPPILDEFLDLYYKNPFRMNENIDFLRIQKEKNLSKEEICVINVIQSNLTDSGTFSLEDLPKMVQEQNEDLIIDAIESLIARKIIIPFSLK